MDNSASGTLGPPLTRSVLWNYAGYFAELAVGVLLLAYIVRRVSVADYGLLLFAQAVAAFLYTVDLGLSNVSTQFYAEKLAHSGIAKVGRAAGTLTLALLCAGALGAVALNCIAHLAPHVIDLPPVAVGLALQLLAILSIAFVLDTAAGPLEHLCQTFHLFNRTNQIRLALVALRVALTIITLEAKTGVVGLAAVQGMLSFLRLVMLWWTADASISGLDLSSTSFEPAVLRDVFKVSKWAFADDVARRISTSAQSVILATFASVSQVALFGMAAKLPTHLYTLAARGIDVTLPTLSHGHHRNDAELSRATYVEAFRLCLTGILPIAVFAAICARPLLTVWAGAPYAAASVVLVWLLASAFTQALMLPSDIVLYTHGKIQLAAKFSLIETVVKLALPLCLVFRYGAAGVAAGVALAHGFVNLVLYLPAACRVAGIPPGNLLGHSLRKTTVLGIAFAVISIALALTTAKLGAPLAFVACVALAFVYAAVWLSTLVLPAWRLRREQLPQGAIR